MVAVGARKRQAELFDEGKLKPHVSATYPLEQAADALLSVFGASPKFAKQVKTRAGAMMISEEFFTVPKVVMVSGGTIPSDHAERLSGEGLYNNYQCL